MLQKDSKVLGQGLLLSSLVTLVTAIVILSCVPPVAKGELVHPLAVRKLYLKLGGMYGIPFMPFSYYPMNLDLLYRIPMYFGNDIIPKFIHSSFALLTAGLFFGCLKRRMGVNYALSGAVFCLPIPTIVNLSISACVDLGVLFFSICLVAASVEVGEKMPAAATTSVVLPVRQAGTNSGFFGWKNFCLLIVS